MRRNTILHLRRRYVPAELAVFFFFLQINSRHPIPSCGCSTSPPLIKELGAAGWTQLTSSGYTSHRVVIKKKENILATGR